MLSDHADYPACAERGRQFINHRALFILSWLINFNVLSLNFAHCGIEWDGNYRLVEPVYMRIRRFLARSGWHRPCAA